LQRLCRKSFVAVALSQGDVSQRVSIETQGDIKTLADALNKSFDDLGALIRLASSSIESSKCIRSNLAKSSQQVNSTLSQAAMTTQQIAVVPKIKQKKLEASTRIVTIF